MRSRSRLIAVLAASVTAAGASSLACHDSFADAGKRATPAPAGAAPTTIALAGPPGKVTPVTNLFVATSREPVPRDQPSPYSLTASDGSGLTLTKVDARAVVEGPLAFTELHLYFHNPEARTREGTFSITLPAGAAVSRFAMESNGQLLEAEMVEKQQARIAYEDFLHRKQDPALLEKAEGNQFSARVFPIPASGDKHLVISFSQEVSPGRYTLPLRGLARAQQIDVRVQVRGASGAIAEQSMHERNWVPDRDVVVDGTQVGAPQAIAAGELTATRIKLELPAAAEAPRAVTLLVDTSASRGLGFGAAARQIHQLVDQLAKDYGGALPIQVVAFDQVTAPLYQGRADQIGNIEKKLTDRGALGASDLGQALRWLAQHAPLARVVVISDGVITAGAQLTELPALVKQLGAHGVERLDMALTGGIRDDQAAAAVAHAGLAHTGAVLDLDKGAGEASHRIGLAVRTELPVTVDGASWVFPRTLAAAQSGDEVTVYARRGKPGAIGLSVAGVRSQATPVAVNPALLGRSVAGAEITELDARLAKATGDEARGLRDKIAKKAIEARVVSSQTSLLVLESDADYARFHIDRRGLADILAIGPSGIELLHRAAPPVQLAQDAVKPAPPSRTKDLVPRPMKKAKQAADSESDDDAPRASRSRSAAAPPADYADKEEAKALDADGIEGGVQGGVIGGSLAGSATGGYGAARAAGPGAPMPEPSADLAPPPPPSAPSPAPSPARMLAQPSHPAPASHTAMMRRRPSADLNAEIADDRESNDDGMAMNRMKPSLHGPLAEIEGALKAGRADAALARATAWHHEAPGDVLALIGLGDALEAKRDLDTAARVYGSIIDLFPARADFRRFAGERLERLGKAQRALIIDTYQRAAEQRPDHLTGHRMLAYALVRDGQYAAAFQAILDGIDRRYPDNRFAGAQRVLADDVGMIAAAYIAHVPGKRGEVLTQLERRGLELATKPSTRFIMYWETDGNDVDFHIRDARGGHAWYSHKQLPSGGELYADITTGYGPECFAIQGAPPAAPYQLAINYYSQGPMGYGMGLLEIQKFDGQGNLAFEDRPYVIMENQAFVDLGSYKP